MLKWSGLGCGGLLGLFIVIAMVVGITSGTPSPEEQGTPSPAFQTIREAFLAGSESGDVLRYEGREFDDDFVQEAVSRVESEAFGDSDKWIVSNSDVIAVCEVIVEVGDTREKGEDPTTTEFENLLRDELGLRGAFLIGAIQSGISDDPEAIVDFCAPILAYGIGFTIAFEAVAELYEFDLDEIDAQARLDITIDEVSRTELRTDRQTAYDKGFLVGMDAARRAIAPSTPTTEPSARATPRTPIAMTPQTIQTTTCQLLCDWDFWVDADAKRVLDVLNEGANVKAEDDQGLTPLHYASGSSTDVSAITLLLDLGADVNATSDQGFTPLHIAASGNPEPSVIALLLDRGADIEARDSNGGTPLHHAVIFVNEDPSVLKLLLDRGANVDAPSKHGDRPCQFAGWWITDLTVIRRLCR